jgi:hypothetical protein
MAMNKIVKKKWLNALRSGEYKQTSECLRDSNGYCCLGVLCEVTGNAQNRNMDQAWPVNDMSEDGFENGSPAPFIGLSASMQETLANMNDANESFDDIAAYISRNVKAK